MKRFSEQLKKKSDSIRLRASERADLRDRLTTYMEYHPLPAEMRAPKAVKKSFAGIAAEPFVAFRFNFSYVKGVASAFAMMVLVAVPVLAEYTAPGDVLYPVKVRFNEEVRSSLAFSPYEKIEWETTRLERRIAEARLLASEGKLTQEVEVEVAEAVKEQSQKTKDQIASLRETNADDAAIAEINFASMLSVQNEVLTNNAEDNEGNEGNQEGRLLAEVVAGESVAAEATQAATKPSYERLLARLEEDTTSAAELFDSVKTIASEDEVRDIERRLEDIARKVNEAVLLANKTTVENSDVASSSEEVSDEARNVALSGNKDQAATLLRVAMTDTRKLMSFMANIDVRTSVTVDELVPVTPTVDERQVVLRSTFTLLEQKKTELAKYNLGQVSQKYAAAKERLGYLVTEARAAQAADNLTTAESRLNEAIAIAEDLLKMVVALDLEEIDEAEAELEAEIDVTATTTATTGPDVVIEDIVSSSSDEVAGST